MYCDELYVYYDEKQLNAISFNIKKLFIKSI